MLKFIGIGSAFNTAEGNTSAYIKKEGKLFLIDCGSANFHTMKESGFLDDVEEIDVYITHTHADHAGSLADLILYFYYAKGEQKPLVTVYAVSELNVNDYLKFNGVDRGVYNYKPMREDDIVELDTFNIFIAPVETHHVKELLSYGVAIRNSKKKTNTFYTGDTYLLSDNINKALEGDLDYLYVDTCSQDYEGNVHLSLFKLHQAVKKENRHKVWCMHLDEKFDKELAKSLGFNVAEVEIQ